MQEVKHAYESLVFLEAGNHASETNAGRPMTICLNGEGLANVYSSDDATVAIPRETAIAYARLFAAAPELLEACQFVFAWAESIVPIENQEEGPVFVKLGAAIAKATGEAKSAAAG